MIIKSTPNSLSATTTTTTTITNESLYSNSYLNELNSQLEDIFKNTNLIKPSNDFSSRSFEAFELSPKPQQKYRNVKKAKKLSNTAKSYYLRSIELSQAKQTKPSDTFLKQAFESKKKKDLTDFLNSSLPEMFLAHSHNNSIQNFNFNTEFTNGALNLDLF